MSLEAKLRSSSLSSRSFTHVWLVGSCWSWSTFSLFVGFFPWGRRLEWIRMVSLDTSGLWSVQQSAPCLVDYASFWWWQCLSFYVQCSLFSLRTFEHVYICIVSLSLAWDCPAQTSSSFCPGRKVGLMTCSTVSFVLSPQSCSEQADSDLTRLVEFGIHLQDARPGCWNRGRRAGG